MNRLDPNERLYDPFGNTLKASGSLAEVNVYQFSSMLAHDPSGLVLYPFRPYEPAFQRWLGRDPYGDAASLGGQAAETAALLTDPPNLYSFALNSPTMYVDTDGRALAIGGVAVGAGLIGTRICLMNPVCRAALLETLRKRERSLGPRALQRMTPNRCARITLSGV